VRDVAETVRRIVRPVPIEVRDDPGDKPAEDEAVPDAAGTHEKSGGRQTVGLDYGIHTFAQWLAYESLDWY
jgi:hypothetical protein